MHNEKSTTYLKQKQQHTSGDRSEPFLTSSIPDLEFDPLAIKLNGSYLEINSEEENITPHFPKIQPT